VKKFLRQLTLELRTETPMPSHGPSSDKPTARSNSSLHSCPVLGVHSTLEQRRVIFQPALTVGGPLRLEQNPASVAEAVLRPALKQPRFKAPWRKNMSF